MDYLWLICFAVLLIAELVTAGALVSIWFAIGAVGAYFAQRLGAGFTAQLAVFIVISVVLLIFTKPFVKKYMVTKTEATNVDRLIGKTAVVTEDIDNVMGTGTVAVEGKTWSAVTADEKPVKKGSKVEILEIKGVKLVVKSEEGEGKCQN